MSPHLVGIAGGTASGKSTISRRLYEHVGGETLAVIQLDQYYRDQDHLSLSERAKVNYDHPDSLELDLLVEHLAQLKAGHVVCTPQYDFAHHTRHKHLTITIEPRPHILVEGILLFAEKSLRETFNTRVFIDTPEDLRLQRRLDRDVRERGRTRDCVRAQWNETVQPMHLAFCEPSRAWAHIVVDGSTCCDCPLDDLWNQISMRSCISDVVS